ncbi:hypothetical protein TL16_g11780 [Triparma laevis f. inornata]|uniref:Uncharacterized protein n=1 Tax=Triparma laevis f. inornata TaxID=1714386 RepID=A0A9W7BM77_9STRA|nr:hypothetical protein TL16_g11780 [Triparma laevis f. inornata]
MPSCSSLLLPLTSLLALFYLYTTITTFSHILYPLSSPHYADIVTNSKTKVEPWFKSGQVDYEVTLMNGDSEDVSKILKSGSIDYTSTFDSHKIPLTLQTSSTPSSTSSSLKQLVKDFGFLVGFYKYLSPSPLKPTIIPLNKNLLTPSTYLNVTLTFFNSQNQIYTVTSTSKILHKTLKKRFPIQHLLKGVENVEEFEEYVPEHIFHLSLTEEVYPYELSRDLNVKRSNGGEVCVLFFVVLVFVAPLDAADLALTHCHPSASALEQGDAWL